LSGPLLITAISLVITAYGKGLLTGVRVIEAVAVGKGVFVIMGKGVSIVGRRVGDEIISVRLISGEGGVEVIDVGSGDSELERISVDLELFDRQDDNANKKIIENPMSFCALFCCIVLAF
jgi:hypothetical protein